MAGALRKTMVYLGLAEDDERYDVDEYADDDPAEREHRQDHRHEHRRDAEVTHLPHRTVAEVVSTQPASGVSRITTIHPRTYNEAKVIGENFRDGIPVIMNLSDMDDSDAKRLVDFAAGLVFGLHGAIERVTAKVFLLSPSTVEVGVEEAGVPSARGLFNQS
jgi:cell division inhibitor SepF